MSAFFGENTIICLYNKDVRDLTAVDSILVKSQRGN